MTAPRPRRMRTGDVIIELSADELAKCTTLAGWMPIEDVAKFKKEKEKERKWTNSPKTR
jgi:MOSC domain-containing protein YiiM